MRANALCCIINVCQGGETKMNEIIKQLLDYQNKITKEFENENSTNIKVRAIKKGHDANRICKLSKHS